MKLINQDYLLKKGDLIEMQFRILSIFQNWQIDSIIEKLKEDPRWIVIDYELVNSTWYSDRLHVKLKILQNPFPLLLVIVAVSSIAVSAFIYLSFDKAELIAEEIPETTKFGIGLFIIILSVIAGYMFIKKKK